jgi:hypothetical protein
MNAAVWIAGGEDYAKEAIASAESMREQMPGLPCILATEVDIEPGPFDHVLKMSERQHPDLWYLDSCRWYSEALAQLADYDKLVFLDTDTFIAWPFWELFDVLDRFDLLGTHGIARHTARTVEILPDSFPELCIGMLGIRNNDKVKRLFTEWLALYQANPHIYGNNDQGPLREALWHNTEIRLYVVTPEYHCRWGFGAYVAGKVRVLHCRNGDQREIARQINDARGGMRLYRPGGIIWRSGD